MTQREPLRKPIVTLVAKGDQALSTDMKEVTLLATTEWAALLDALAVIRMDLSRIAESKSMPESDKLERLRFAIVAIDAVTAEVKKAGDLDFIDTRSAMIPQAREHVDGHDRDPQTLGAGVRLEDFSPRGLEPGG